MSELPHLDLSKINWTAAVAVAVQVVGLIAWLASEHSALIALDRRFSDYQSDQTNRTTGIVHAFDANQANQDQAIARHEAIITRLDTSGGRQLGIVTEKQKYLFEIVKEVQKEIDELKSRRR